jgi:hypothetical protein
MQKTTDPEVLRAAKLLDANQRTSIVFEDPVAEFKYKIRQHD